MPGPAFPQVPLIIDQDIPANGTMVTIPIDTTGYRDKTFFFETDGDTAVWIKGGPNEDKMAVLVTGDNVGTEDAALVWDVNDTRKGFAIKTYLPYTQLVIKNEAGATVKASAWIGGSGK